MGKREVARDAGRFSVIRYQPATADTKLADAGYQSATADTELDEPRYKPAAADTKFADAGYKPAAADTELAGAGYKPAIADTPLAETKNACIFPSTMPAEITATFPAQPAAAAGLDTERTIAAVAHPTRRAILFYLADGQPRAVATIAAAVGTMDTLAGKHLILLHKAGLIEPVAPPDGDGRKSYYRLRDGFLAHDAAGRIVLDLGPVALRAK